MGLVSVVRLPISQNGKGRDHNGNGFTLLMPGGVGDSSLDTSMELRTTWMIEPSQTAWE